MKYTYTKTPFDQIATIADAFCNKHGDQPDGSVSDEDFCKFHDHLEKMFSKHGSYAGDSDDDSVDFDASRSSGDLVPVVGVVPKEGLAPEVALAAGLEAVRSSHRPLAIQFDFDPHGLLVCTPNEAFGTYSEMALIP